MHCGIIEQPKKKFPMEAVGFGLIGPWQELSIKACSKEKPVFRMLHPDLCAADRSILNVTDFDSQGRGTVQADPSVGLGKQSRLVNDSLSGATAGKPSQPHYEHRQLAHQKVVVGKTTDCTSELNAGRADGRRPSGWNKELPRPDGFWFSEL
jgi:hypothetical protein